MQTGRERKNKRQQKKNMTGGRALWYSTGLIEMMSPSPLESIAMMRKATAEMERKGGIPF